MSIPYSGEDFEIEMSDAEYLLVLEHADIKIMRNI